MIKEYLNSSRYAYIEFETSQLGQDFLDKYREKPEEEQPKIEETVVNVGTLMYIQNLVRKGELLYRLVVG